jgi:hypothetical protein
MSERKSKKHDENAEDPRAEDPGTYSKPEVIDSRPVHPDDQEIDPANTGPGAPAYDSGQDQLGSNPAKKKGAHKK